ncbi:MAG TPA: nitroreductase family protein [Synergistales bacterium]|mgnify:FL=1|nr:nitroreductase family protein [Synergistales bacterium]HRV71114.1 nitroreductase family protein [Thermovirgaceae bacterium]
METKAIDAILSRRSIRKFSGKTVNEATVETLLKAAMSAPSAHNQQPWEFVVITDREILDSIPSFHPYSKMLLQAPVAIMVCSRTEGLPAEGFWPQDCAAATQNMLVAANSLGLGSVWLGIFPHQDLVEKSRQVCGIPVEITPFCFVALGYPAEEKGPSKRFDPDRIHENHW